MPSTARIRIEEAPQPSSRARRAPGFGIKGPKRAERRAALRSVPAWEGAPAARRSGADVVPARRDRLSAMMTYLRDVRRHELMSREEEHEVAVKFIETGDARLASRLVTANLRLVVKIALEYRTSHRNVLDLVQEGNVGLIHAVHKYDPHRGVKLATYASWWIRAYILKFILSNARLVKLGTTQAQRRLFFGLRRERARLEGRDGRAIEVRQLAATFDVSEKEVTEMERRLSASETSLDWPTRDDTDDRRVGDGVSADPTHRPDTQSETHEFREVLMRELAVFEKTLSGRDSEIFKGRLVCEDATTLAEIATRFGVSRERVRQIEERLKQRLRRHLQATLGDAVPAMAAKSDT
jgi:RNA polymerase sigma-32 factor